MTSYVNILQMHMLNVIGWSHAMVVWDGGRSRRTTSERMMGRGSRSSTRQRRRVTGVTSRMVVTLSRNIDATAVKPHYHITTNQP